MLTKNDGSALVVEGSDLTVQDGKADISTASGLVSERRSGIAIFFSILAIIIRISLQLILMVAVLAGSYMAMNKLIAGKPEVRKRPRFKTVYAVQTQPVLLSDHQPTFIVYGETAASRTVDLRSLVSGEVTFVNEKLRVGNRVEKGQALVSIDRFNFEGALREAKANRNEVDARITENESRITMETNRLRSSKEQLELARSDHQRIKSLIAKGTTTQKQLDDRLLILSQRGQSVDQSRVTLETENAKMKQLDASLERLEWRIQQAERNLENTTLKAPFAGIVQSSNVEIGKTVSANDVAVTLYEDNNIETRFTLTDERFGRLQAGKSGLIGREIKVIWTIGGHEYIYPARISRIGAEISSKRGGVEMFASMKQIKTNPAIRPGAFVEIHVPDKVFYNTAIVPESAIYNGDHVYLKKADRLISEPVKIYAYDNGSVIIGGTLNNGDRILTTRIAEIGDGIRVREEGAKPDPGKKRGPGKKPVAGN